MKAPRDHQTIQIDITNACIHTCSNCTRSCMHQKKPFMMDYETFCKAVDSIIEHPGLIGVMGGEPTLHPDFEKMCMYLQDKLDDNLLPESGVLSSPTDDYFKMWKLYETKRREIYEYSDGPRAIIKGAAIFTSVSKEFLKHLETIQETFIHQCMNDHIGVSLHQPVLIARKDIGIEDDEWLKLREKCWVNQTWSSSITPKGCFFCEIAGALDYMYDGPGGLPIEKGWWDKDISAFEEQFHWCELCGIPLKTFSRDARESITDVSRINMDLMKEHGCIRLDEKHINVVEKKDGKFLENNLGKYVGRQYVENESDKLTGKAPMFADEFYGIVLCGAGDEEDCGDDCNEKVLKEIYKVGSDRGFSGLERCVDNIGENKYVFIFTPEIMLKEEGVSKLKKCVINPGTLHYIDFAEPHNNQNDYIYNAEKMKKGICILLNTSAHSLRDNLDVLRERYAQPSDLKRNWQKEKVVELSNSMNNAIYNGKALRNNELSIIRWKSLIHRSKIHEVARYCVRKIKNHLFIRDKSLWL